jgi:hypothetical protein
VKFWHKTAIALSVTIVWYVSVNIAFDLGTDTSFCVVTHLQTDKSVSEIESCQRANPVKYFPVKQIRHSWLVINGDEVK